MRGRGTVAVGWLVAACALLLSACGAAATATPTVVPTATSAPPLTASATNTPRPTNTATATPLPPTATPTPAPTEPPHGTPDDAKWRELQAQDYRLVTTALTQGPESFQYAAYLLTNPAYQSQVMATLGGEPGTETGPGICTILFYRWDGAAYSLVQSIGEADEPIACALVNWNEMKYTGGDEAKSAMHLDGNWSDVNDNGLPELAVDYLYCIFCWGIEGTGLRLFELRTTSSVVDLTMNLPGEVLSGTFFHSDDPLTLQVFDPVGRKDEAVDRFWYYQWQNNQYVNVSQEFAADYQSQVDAEVARIRENYNQPGIGGSLSSFHAILVLSETGGLSREKALETFLDVTDLNHWDQTTRPNRCWLQVARAHVQMDFEAGHSLEPYLYENIIFASNGPAHTLSELTTDIDQTRFDVSACLE